MKTNLSPCLLGSLSPCLLSLPLWILFASTSHTAELEQKQGKAVVRVLADRVENGQAEMRLSDKLTLTFSIEASAALEVQPMEKVITSPDWEVSGKSNPQKTPLGKGMVRWQQTITLTPLNTGDVKLPLEPLQYREDLASNVWEKAEWKAIRVRVSTEIIAADLRELRDVTPPEQLPPLPVWRVQVYWAALPLALACLCLGVVYYRRRARRPVVLPPDQWALRELERIEKLPLATQTEVDQFLTLLSDVVRKYLELRFQLPAPEQTTAEFVAQMHNSSEPKPDQQEMLRDLLERCDLAKFARVTPAPEECRAAAATARTFVERTAAPAKPDDN